MSGGGTTSGAGDEDAEYRALLAEARNRPDDGLADLKEMVRRKLAACRAAKESAREATPTPADTAAEQGLGEDLRGPRQGLSTERFLDAVQRDEDAGLHAPALATDTNKEDAWGEELDRHPIGGHRAAPTPGQPDPAERERIAEIIDPDAFRVGGPTLSSVSFRDAIRADGKREAFEKADQILATLAPSPAPDRGRELTASAAERVCHDEQMTIWTGEIVGSLSMSGYLRDDLSYDDVLGVNEALAREVRSIVESAFTHPELASHKATAAIGTGDLGGERGR